MSITTARTPLMASMAAPSLKRIPFLLPAPIPAKKARGTLSTSAQGQLITRKDRAVYTQYSQFPVTREGRMAVAAAMPTTTGV